MTMKPTLVVASALYLLSMHAEADAHAFLLASAPAVGSQVQAPKTLRLEFSEAVELGFSGVEMAGTASEAVALQNLRYDPADHKVLLADIPQIGPGSYRVRWHVVSVDTHRTEGDFVFRVKS
jgi:methionine-rich copper-binding protein CopC